MTAQSGRTLLLKVQNTTTSLFETVGGLRTHGIDLVQELVDTTHNESAGRWRELIGDAGLRRATITGTGLFRNAASDARVRGLFFDGALATWQIILPQEGTFEGPFLVAALDYAARHDDAVTFEMTLESAGALTFTALA
ncbi:MAG: phage major tail protein, TP901-1 family [Pseudomonadota bacterium]